MGGASEKALEERYESLLMHAPTPICVTRGPAHRIELMNPAYLALTGGAEAVGKPFREAHTGMDAEYYFQVMDRVFRTGERFVATEAAVRMRHQGQTSQTPAARERYFNIVCEPLYAAGGGATAVRVIDGLMIFAVEVTAHVRGRLVLEEAQRRSQFLVEATSALSESLDYQRTLQRVAELAVPRMADWCTVTVVDDKGVFRRVAVVHRDPAKQGLTAEYAVKFPPGDHRAGTMTGVLQQGRAALSARVTDGDLVQAAQSKDHLRIMRGLGCSSCIMVPMAVRGEVLGVISLMRADSSPAYGEAEVAVAEELAHRAALAVDSARLYAEARRQEKTMRFFAEASTLLSSSLDYESICQRLARLVVPAFADWCGVDVKEDSETGSHAEIRQLAVAHVDPAKVQFAVELQRRYPPNPDEPTGVPNVLRTGRSEIYEEIPDELLVRGARDDEHLRILRQLGLRSVLVVPLLASGRTLGALSLVWAESDRRYGPDDVKMMEELGRRAGLAIENARLYRETRRAVSQRDEFLSIASHELRTPLTSLQLQVSGIRRALEKRAPLDLSKLSPRVLMVDKQLARLGQLINGLLDVTRAAAGRLHLDIEDVDLGQVAREVGERFQEDLAHAGCPLSIDAGGPVVGRWDRLRLDEIVTNFLANAIKYGAGRPIQITASASGATATLQVRDQGIGIAPDDQQRIFNRFTRAVSPDHYGGFGLGLWIVRVLVETMGGSVHVQSDVGKGSLFTVELPLGTDHGQPTTL